MKNKLKDFAKNKKVQLAAAVTATVLLIIAGSTLAWFTYKDGLKTAAKIKEPTEIQVRAGNAEDIDRLDLGNINIDDAEEDGAVKTDESTYVRRYVFCVCSELDEYTTQSDYIIQLAHTTNIDFTYEIFAATDVTNGGGNEGGVTVDYTDLSGGTHTYEKGEPIELTEVANASNYADTYGEYENVQQNAKPLYYQSEKITTHTNKTSKYNDTDWNFVDFYILEVSWDETEAKKWLDKESDMVYLLADTD
jgi:hypothetical protein